MIIILKCHCRVDVIATRKVERQSIQKYAPRDIQTRVEKTYIFKGNIFRFLDVLGFSVQRPDTKSLLIHHSPCHIIFYKL